ncbi:MAG: chemotaxis protein CheW [Terriglobales bacterium]
MSSTEQQFCTFFIERLLFGVEVEKVQEVIRHQGLTRVPLATELVGGLINLRGQIVTAVNLRRRLGLQDSPPGQLPMNVVVRTGEGVVSLLVDEINDVIEVEQKAFEPPPDTLDVAGRELIQGVYKLKDKLLLVLDTDKAANVSAHRSDKR